MKKNSVRVWVGCGIFCIAAVLLSVWYAVTFNDSRLVVPMDFESYAFTPRDLPMIVSILGACGLRVVWIFTVFRAVPTLTTLYLSYPVSWSVTAAVDLVCFLMIKKRFPKER